MRKYEGLFIIKPDIDQGNQDKVVNFIKETITKNGGKVINSEIWGRRRLAYKIKGHEEGFYYLFNFETEPKTISILKREYRLNENIIRELITVK